MMRDGPANEARPPGAAADEVPDQWHQHAGVSPRLSEPVEALVSMEIVDVRLVRDPKCTGDAKVELHLRVTGLDELYRAVGARVVGALFDPEFE
jgi:hypothetical protein